MLRWLANLSNGGGTSRLRLAAAIALVVHWSIPALSLPQFNGASRAAHEYSSAERKAQPGAAPRVDAQYSPLPGGWRSGSRETVDAIGPLAIAPSVWVLGPPSAHSAAPLPAPSSFSTTKARAFNARAPPSAGV